MRKRPHERLPIEPDWIDFDWFLVSCSCGWYARRPTRQKAKREFWHHLAHLGYVEKAGSVGPRM